MLNEREFMYRVQIPRSEERKANEFPTRRRRIWVEPSVNVFDSSNKWHTRKKTCLMGVPKTYIPLLTCQGPQYPTYYPPKEHIFAGNEYTSCTISVAYLLSLLQMERIVCIVWKSHFGNDLLSEKDE